MVIIAFAFSFSFVRTVYLHLLTKYGRAQMDLLSIKCPFIEIELELGMMEN